MKKIIPILVFSVIILLSTYASAKEIPFTLEDRDRLIRLETKIEEGFKATNQRIEDTNQRIGDSNRRIDELKDSLQVVENRIDALIYAVLGCFIAFIGIVIWDRRTAISPAIKKNKELEEREDRLEKVLKEYAYREPGLAEILRSVGIM